MLYRLFSTGKLSTLAQINIGAAAQYFTTLSDEERIKLLPEFGDYTYQLIQNTDTHEFVRYNQLEELITFNVTSELPPIKLPTNSKDVLDTFYRQAIQSKDMKALNSSFHLYWHNFNAEIPFKDTIEYLLNSFPVGNEENRQLWKILTSHMVYYALPDLSTELLNTYLRQISRHCNLYTASALPVLAKISHLAANPKAYPNIAHALIHFKGITTGLLEKNYEIQDYELAKGYLYSLINVEPAPSSPQFTEEFINLLIRCALEVNDWDLIFHLYENTQSITGHSNSPVLYAALMKYIHKHNIEGSKKDAMDSNYYIEIIDRFKEDYSDNYNILFKYSAAADSYAHALFEAGEIYTAANFIYDLSKANIPFSTKLTVRLGEIAFETDDLNLMLLVLQCDLSKIENKYLIKLREAIRRKLKREEKEYVKTFDEKVHHTQPHDYLRKLVQEAIMRRALVKREEDSTQKQA